MSRRTIIPLLLTFCLIVLPMPPAPPAGLASHAVPPSAAPAVAREQATPLGTASRSVVPQAICPDNYEPNGSFAAAWPLQPGTITSYICTPQDYDYFTFNVANNEQIRLDLFSLPQNYDLCLFEPKQAQISCTGSGGTTAETIEATAPYAGNYFALVFGVQGEYHASDSYALRIQVGASSESLSIISGPTVVSAKRTSAQISWTTSRPADSRVRYGTSPLVLSDEVFTASLVMEHLVTLTGLTPATTYRYDIQSAAPGGATVTSRAAYFTTAPPPNPGPPTIAGLRASRLPTMLELYQVEADVADDGEVARVEFYLDDTLIATDYSGEPTASAVLAPSSMGLSRAEFFANHRLWARVYDRAGLVRDDTIFWEPAPEPATIEMHMWPAGDVQVYVPGSSVPAGRILTIEISEQEQEYDCHLEWVRVGGHETFVEVCPSPHPAERVEIFIDEVQVYDQPGSTWRHVYDWPIGGLGLGTHTIRGVVTGRAGGVEQRTAEVAILRGERILDLSRAIERTDNYFEVWLEVANTGTLDVELAEVVENLTGFQAFDVSGTVYDGAVSYDESTARCTIDFTLSSSAGDYLLLRPGQTTRLYYRAAPILYADPAIDHAFGAEPVHVEDRWSLYSADLARETISLSSGERIGDAVEAARTAADYLIVTRPDALFDLYNDAGVNSLLASMAELARFRQGLLGYLPDDSLSVGEVRDIIHTWGATMRGSDGVAGGYADNGYLLLVGEDEVVPTYNPDFDVIGYDNIDRADLYYANTAGWWVNPELIVSRIIGNSADELEAPLRTSLAVKSGTLGPGLRRTSALAVAGDGDGQRSFERNVNDAVAVIDDEFTTVAGLFVGDIFDSGGDPAARFRDEVEDRNLIFYRDHCNGYGWSDVVDDGDFPLNFGTAYPFAFACCCKAGRYKDVGSGGIAEAFLEHGAAVYIGATENSHRSTNNEAGLWFFNRWIGGTDSVGRVFRDLKRHLDGYYDDYWTVEYQMYGDPKLGGAATVATVAAVPPAAPPTTLQVTVPDYLVSRIDGYDWVTIPGGGLVNEPNHPYVPNYSLEVTLPAGTRVQEVRLVSRAAPLAVPGLNLFAGIEPIDAPSLVGQAQPAPDGWWPATPLSWRVEQHAGGTGTLYITLYPFVYRQATQEANFYKSYDLALSYSQSAISLNLVEEPLVIPGVDEELIGYLRIMNSGQPVDAVVSALIRPELREATSFSLPLQTLVSVQDGSVLPLRWESGSATPGAYLIDLELRDPQGDLLDSVQGRFQLGLTAAEAHDLSATPLRFLPGATVDTVFTLSNNGGTVISGTAVLEVISLSSGELVAQQEQVLGPLAPGSDLLVQQSWLSTPANRGPYRLVAYVLYNGTRTNLLETTIAGPAYLILPMIRL